MERRLEIAFEQTDGETAVGGISSRIPERLSDDNSFPAGALVEDGEVDAEVGGVIVRHFGHKYFDKDLRNGMVQRGDDVLDLLLVFDGCGDQERIGVLIGNDIDLAGE